MRLIDADAYLKKVCTYNETGCGSCRLQTKCPVDEPTVDVAPVRHGKWTPHEEMSDEWNCSETWYRCQCGYDTRRKTPYCPMCGARMDEE